MSRTRTRSRAQAEAMYGGDSDGQEFEVFPINREPIRTSERLDHTAEAGAGYSGRIRTMKDLPLSPQDIEGSGRRSRSYFSHQETSSQEPEKLRRSATERYRTLSGNSRPVDSTGYYTSPERMASSSHPRRSSVDHTERTYAQGSVPYDSRHMFPEAISEARRVHFEAERKLSTCMKEKKAIAEQLVQTTEKLNASQRLNQELEAQVKHLTDGLETMKEQLRDSENRRRKTARLFQETASELNGANYYLTTADAASETDVVDILDNLNAEIMQTSALMADALAELPREREPGSKTVSNERLFNQRALGDTMMGYIQADAEVIDPMAVQLALQFCIAETCYVVVESWHPGDWRGDDVLNNIYASMKKTVIQAVSGRWRSLTRSQTIFQESHAAVYSYLHRRIKDLLSFAGWTQNIQRNHDFLASVQDRIELIVTLSLRLHRASSVDITSGELRTKILYPKEKFDHALVDEAFPNEIDPRDRQQETIAGTTDLGMVKYVGAESKTLRKPKVVLVSALRALLDG